MKLKESENEHRRASTTSMKEKSNGETSRNCLRSMAIVYDRGSCPAGHRRGRVRTCYPATVRIAYGQLCVYLAGFDCNSY